MQTAIDRTVIGSNMSSWLAFAVEVGRSLRQVLFMDSVDFPRAVMILRRARNLVQHLFSVDVGLVHYINQAVGLG